jgi:hypothetical protein
VQSKIRGIDMIYKLACERKIIAPQPIPPILMPRQQLNFAGGEHRWQNLILGVFNPLVITAMMRTVLLQADEYGPLFDEMRNQFNYRNEFAFTTLRDENVSGEDKALLETLGLKMA